MEYLCLYFLKSLIKEDLNYYKHCYFSRHEHKANCKQHQLDLKVFISSIGLNHLK